MKRKTNLRVIFLCVLLSFSILLSQENDNEAILIDFSDFIKKVIDDWNIPGIAVGVVKDGKIIYLNSFGLRNIDKKLLVTNQTIFPICSVTKTFTSMSIGMLVDDGKLELDTPVIEYMPDFLLADKSTTNGVTTRDLLSHRTGLPGYDAIWILSNKRRNEIYNNLRFLKPNSAFGDVFQYNNLMYMVSGKLVGHLYDESWEDFVTKRIFKPLGMSQSNFSINDSMNSGNFSFPYLTFNGNTVQMPFRNMESIGPAGSINSNIEDMTKWLLFNVNNGRIGDNKLITDYSHSQIYLPHTDIIDSLWVKTLQASKYGLGWAISNFRGYKLVEHSGNIDGFSALISLLPDKKIGIVVLSNSLNIAGYVLAREIYDRYLGVDETNWNSYFKHVFLEISKLSSNKKIEELPTPKTKPSLPISDYVGIYENSALGKVRISEIGTKLMLEFASGLTSSLEHKQLDVFSGRTLDFWFPSIEVSFHLGTDGVVESLSIPIERGVKPFIFLNSSNKLKENIIFKSDELEENSVAYKRLVDKSPLHNESSRLSISNTEQVKENLKMINKTDEISTHILLIVIKKHKPSFSDPLQLIEGQHVRIENKHTNYKGWIWTITENGKTGWTPEQYLDINWVKNNAVVKIDYDAKELDVAVGDVLTMVCEVNEWYWVKTINNEYGWVPKSNVNM